MKVLIVVHSPTWFTELSVLGRYIHTQPNHQVTFHIIDYAHWTMQEFAAGLRRDGIPCTLECEEGPPRERAAAGSARTVPGPYVRLRNRVVEAAKIILRRFGSVVAGDFLIQLHSLSAAIADARALAQVHNPDVVVLGGNNPGYTTPALISGFRKAGKPTVIVSSTMSNGLEEAAVYASDPRYHVTGWRAHFVAANFPKWVIDYNGKRLLRCPVGRVLALEALRISPPRPWVFNSGYAAAIAMESKAMVEYYAEAGLPRDKMILTGAPSDDVMAKIAANAARLRQELYADLGLPAGRPMLLTALVPDFLYVNGGRPECDFQNYDALVDFWIRALSDQQSFNVVVALHPSVQIATMRHIERPNVRIAARKTADLVPLCDLYVASISSTIRWAIACGKPVINYDVYRYRYTDFLAVSGVIATEEQSEFCSLIKRFANDSDYLKQITTRQQSESSQWGQLDGNSTQRIVALLVRISDTTVNRVSLAPAA
jgi:hypothetical protein